MPFRSQRQRAWAAEQVRQGKWTQAQFDEWNSDTPKDLPEKTPPKRRGKMFKKRKQRR